MTKGKWFTRALHVTIALSFVLGAFVVAPSAVSAADPNTSEWLKQGTPTEEDLVLLPGSDIIDFDVAGDGKTIYAIGTLQKGCDPEDMDYWAPSVMGPFDLFSISQFPKLWKSTDGGVTWSDKTSKVLDAKNLPDLLDIGAPFDTDWEDFTFFTAVSVAPDDPNFVVVAGWSFDADGVAVPDPDGGGPAVAFTRNYFPVVVGSNDGASKFNYMGCAAAEGMITCIDVSMEIDDKHSIAIGTWDWEADVVYGWDYAYDLARVWRYDAGGYWSAYWADASTYDGWEPSKAIVDLEFSPNFDVDDAVVILSVNEVNDPAAPGPYLGFMLQAATWNSIDAWNAEAEFDSYPVLIENAGNAIVSPLVFDGWDMVGALVRHAGDLDLPYDYMGDDNSDRKMMVAVNGMEFNLSSLSQVDDGGFLFWIENTEISEEMLYKEDNPYISTIDYAGNIDMEGRTLVGLAFPKDWKWQEIEVWFDSFGMDPEAAIGCCKGVQVLRSETTDVCCPDWDWACKPPSGQFLATVMMTADGDWAYAGTMGESYIAMELIPEFGWWSDESAFSISGHEGDLGNAWNQSGLIDTDIDAIADVAVASDPSGDDLCSPSCSCIYIATINYEVPLPQTGPAPLWNIEGKICGCDSIWRSCDGGKSWLRIWHKELQGDVMNAPDPYDWPSSESFVPPPAPEPGQGPWSAMEWMTIELVPGETTPTTIYMADLGTETVWVSTASGDACCPAGLGCWNDRNTGLGNRYWDDLMMEMVVEGDGGIADIAVLDESTIYAVAFNADMVKSTSGGRHWSSQVDTKVDDDSGELAHDIIAMGDWVVLGGDLGTVSYSEDGGDSFKVLDDIGTGQVHVAFDSYFDDNGYLYAAVAGTDNGIYRTTIDDADFENMDACDELDYWGIVVSDADGNPKTTASTGGVLYASYNGSYNATAGDCKNSGVARILNPAAQDCCGSLSWDYLFDNLWTFAEFTNQPTNIAICGDASGGATTIWALDTHMYWDGWNECYTEFYDGDWGRLWKFNDVFAKSGPELIGVANGATIPSGSCSDCGNDDFVLEWDRICDACEYDIQIALDEGF
ncbi:MAG: hypothetical protein M0R22_12470, partial [Dehalococcoidia bacterium]|nr:hypothetical protein [Dehalococcoidia bacterium]